jgi:GT2 family glycosyltransferase
MLPVTFSIVVLTHNRCDVLLELLEELSSLRRFNTEVIVVDNGSVDGTSVTVRERYPEFMVVETNVNLGAVGRNEGIRLAKGEYIVTIDDDILGLTDDSLACLQAFFERHPATGAICFKVLDHYLGAVCNWCHPCKPEEGEDLTFETTEISEGAVVFRRKLLDVTGLYTREMFISHEGADLAARILDNGYSIYYLSQVTVTHKYAETGRPNWRRYYYDTRNDFWLVVRNYRLLHLLAHLARRLPATFIYSLLDGYIFYWFKAIWNSLLEFPEMLRQRKPISRETHRKMRQINKMRPGFFYLFKRRIFARDVKL